MQQQGGVLGSQEGALSSVHLRGVRKDTQDRTHLQPQDFEVKAERVGGRGQSGEHCPLDTNQSSMKFYLLKKTGK